MHRDKTGFGFSALLHALQHQHSCCIISISHHGVETAEIKPVCAIVYTALSLTSLFCNASLSGEKMAALLKRRVTIQWIGQFVSDGTASPFIPSYLC